ncbi:hypothetical protein IGK74_001344 [Enterococcus sp. AZ150]|uniref:Glycosyl transferase family 28 C-terminal domain-containing protein n=1 Tax=Enterococcus sulfureus ATCC 49903 TaxID=1140003 RepID=S0PFH7_9ENTE|nr:PssE/Cps14G family polysaccharide biosynthesis glycosyltransferase [Enterococcus sulfureus]EOT49314.1 hypothetical protein OMY_00242 [Enterococcus sulfureus ATCC 49903]EOT87181.1 hypothetical protein I573_00237 [Enterococcus sulfureus ATCC 49903]
MIFITVGTHEQQFNRLLKKIDEISASMPDVEFFVQTGYSDYKLKNCNYRKFLNYKEMNEFIENADLIITHGGPSSFFSVLLKNKPLIVVPRKFEYGEHVNNHQLEFLKNINDKGYNIEFIENLDYLEEKITKNTSSKIFKSNHKIFIANFRKEVESLL